MNAEQFILDLLNGVSGIDFQLVTKIFGFTLVIFWIVILGWVWADSGERVSNSVSRIGYVLIVLFFNIFGLIIYLIIRPSETIEQIYWSDLERRFLKYETAELGDCPKCGHQIYPGFVFCSHCGNELKIKCPNCEVYVDKKYKFCPFCNTQVGNYARKEILPTVEVMEKQIQETKEEATEMVESKKTKYKTRTDLVMKIGNRVIGIYEGVKKGITSLFRKGNGKKNSEGNNSVKRVFNIKKHDKKQAQDFSKTKENNKVSKKKNTKNKKKKSQKKKKRK